MFTQVEIKENSIKFTFEVCTEDISGDTSLTEAAEYLKKYITRDILSGALLVCWVEVPEDNKSIVIHLSKTAFIIASTLSKDGEYFLKDVYLTLYRILYGSFENILRTQLENCEISQAISPELWADTTEYDIKVIRS